jgi:hypothetical protein
LQIGLEFDRRRAHGKLLPRNLIQALHIARRHEPWHDYKPLFAHGAELLP